MKPTQLALASILTLVCALSARADKIATNFKSNGFQGQGYDENIGWEFVPNVTISVTKLGWFDNIYAPFNELPGFRVAHTVAIFNMNGSPLATASMPAGTVTPVEGPDITNQFGDSLGVCRYVAITPVVLNAQQHYVISGTNPLPGDSFAVGFPVSQLGMTSEIEFVQGRVSDWGTASVLTFPGIAEPPSTWNARDFGPNFQFNVVPEPTTLVLATLAGVLLIATRPNFASSVA
jgi:hypothetical protein